MGKSLDLKRQEANERQQKRNKRSPQDQIAVLDKKFGKDTGASKERAKLIALTEKSVERSEKIKEEKPKKRKKKDE